VVLADAGANKINVIKEVRAITGPGPEGSQGPGRRRSEDRQGRRDQGEAEKIKKKLEAAGAKVEIK
jgi:large subunit ribosomal protein L7/L12